MSDLLKLIYLFTFPSFEVVFFLTKTDHGLIFMSRCRLKHLKMTKVTSEKRQMLKFMFLSRKSISSRNDLKKERCWLKICFWSDWGEKKHLCPRGVSSVSLSADTQLLPVVSSEEVTSRRSDRKKGEIKARLTCTADVLTVRKVRLTAGHIHRAWTQPPEHTFRSSCRGLCGTRPNRIRHWKTCSRRISLMCHKT